MGRRKKSECEGPSESWILGRQKLLMAGFASFAEKGYRGATVRDIVGRINFSVNAISIYFGSKQGLANAAIETLKKSVTLPLAHADETIQSDYTWRVAVKSFVWQVLALFAAKDEPNCYLAPLYRHESAHLHDKKISLQNEIIRPIFERLEGLIAMGVPDRDPVLVRLWTLALWNNVVGYALKHPIVLAEDVPAGMDLAIFRQMAVDFMIDKCTRDLTFSPLTKPAASTEGQTPA